MDPLSSRSQRNLYQSYFPSGGNPSNGQSRARKGKPSESFLSLCIEFCITALPACKWIPGSGSLRAHSAGCSPNKGLNCRKSLSPLFVFPFCREVLRIHGKPEHCDGSLQVRLAPPDQPGGHWNSALLGSRALIEWLLPEAVKFGDHCNG